MEGKERGQFGQKVWGEQKPIVRPSMGRTKELGETETGKNLALREVGRGVAQDGPRWASRALTTARGALLSCQPGFSNRSRLTSGHEIRLTGLARSFKK